ncbi:hypothetical protein GCM10022399_28710 [Terrabacter ginsenosidimutans]|jgi:hypothetical protein|uniref:Uncharacterized protein n=1 Tax=Terrabacter ginsenosidimutans TaxID=490575 RepID=A0ABP7DWL7_9MICO
MTISGPDRDWVANDHDTASGHRERTNSSFKRFHPQAFFGEDWHAHVPASEDWDPDRVCPEGNPMTRPKDGTGEVYVERRDGMDAWRAAWMCVDEREVLTASELGPSCATLDECIAWALHEARPARVSINLLT